MISNCLTKGYAKSMGEAVGKKSLLGVLVESNKRCLLPSFFCMDSISKLVHKFGHEQFVFSVKFLFIGKFMFGYWGPYLFVYRAVLYHLSHIMVIFRPHQHLFWIKEWSRNMVKWVVKCLYNGWVLVLKIGLGKM